MKRNGALLAGVALLLVASPSFAQSVMKKIEAANARFEQESAKGNAPALTSWCGARSATTGSSMPISGT